MQIFRQGQQFEKVKKRNKNVKIENEKKNKK